MNPLRYESVPEQDWLSIMKKELLESQKSKETLYNFDFNEDKFKSGCYIWEKVQDPFRDVKNKH